MLARAVVILVLQLAATVAAGQSAVTLRRAASQTAPGPVLLGTIADLSGPDAGTLAGITVLERADAGTATITLADVRAALTRARVNWGRVTLGGGDARLTIADAATDTPAAPMAADPRREFALAHGDDGSVHAAVLARLGDLFNVSASDLRVRIASLPSEAAGLLAQPVDGRRVDVRPGAASTSGRVPLKIEVYRGDRVEASAAIGVEVQLRRRAATVVAAVARQQPIADGNLVEIDAWLSPAEPAPLAIDAVRGQMARGRLEPGRPIGAEDLQSPVVVNRGDVVLVDCLSGGIVLKAKARALATARDGELVKLQLESGGKSFQARMNGRGRAVMALDSVPEEPTVKRSRPPAE